DNANFDSSNDESLPDEDVPAEEFKIYSNPLFDEDEINSDKLDPHCFNVESDFVESLLNRDTFINFSSKFDFSGELAHIKPEILKPDFDFEEEIRLIENLLYDNSFPRPPEELNAEIADTIIESIPLLPIPVQDGNSQQEQIDIVTETDDVLSPSDDNDDDLSNDSLLEEADLFLSDNLIPPGIENIDDDPEGDIHFLEELLIDDSILSHELSDFNFEDNPSIPRPPPEPPDAKTDAGVEIPVVLNDKDENDDYSSFIFVNFDRVFSLLSAERGSHFTNVPAFDKEDFMSWKVRFLVFFDGLEPYLLKTLEDGPFVPMSSLSTSKNPLPKHQNQWSNAESRLGNQDKRSKNIIISCLPNDVMKSVIKCKTAKEMYNNLILAHKGQSDTRDTKIAALRLKFNAFKSLKGEKVNGTFTSKVTLDQLLSKQVPINIVKALGGKYRRKEKISSKEVIFTKADESPYVLAPEITSNLESECDSQEPLPSLPKIIGAAPSGTSESYFFV
nr:hypothetical protein [Tanacetum cinerariifolium]